MTSTAAADIGTDVGIKNVRRRTVAQAIVEYLQVQYSELDGERRRLVPGMYGIFGHGNSVGLAQGIDEYGVDFPHYQGKNEQSMVHAAIGFAKASNRAATLACTASAGPGSTNMVSGAATATTNRLPVLLFPADIINNRFGDPVLQQIEATPFFQSIRGGLVVSLYNQPEVWPIFGYEGESFSKGGYIARGFNDIEWL